MLSRKGSWLLAISVAWILTAGTVPPFAGRFGAGHVVLRFASFPGPEVQAALERRGVHVLAVVPPRGLLVASDHPWQGSDLAMLPPVALTRSMKVAREVESDPRHSYLVVFHSDVDGDLAWRLAEEAGLEIVDRPGLLPGHLLVAGSFGGAMALAERDEVAKILRPSTLLLAHGPVHGCSGPISEAGPVADYVLEGSGWSGKGSGAVQLQFALDNFSAKLSESVVTDQIGKAIQEWTRYANLTISHGTQEGAARTIEVLFASGAHGDAFPFTNMSTLAHTFYPVPANAEPLAGDIHFNNMEAWNSTAGVDLYSVALHEVGHALGLGHSTDPNAVMYPYYRTMSGLGQDDIAAIQALYGASGSTQSSSAPPTPPTPAPPSPPTPAPPVTPTQPSTPVQNPGSGDTVAPKLAITWPVGTIVSAYSASITISGTASDNVGVASVVWSTSTGGTGTASGTATWSANIPLLVGNNAVTVRAYDAAGNSTWRSLSVVRVN